MISKFANLPRQHLSQHYHMHPRRPTHTHTNNQHYHNHHQYHSNHSNHFSDMNQPPNTFDGPKAINNHNGSNNISNSGGNNSNDVELMMELPPSSPISQASHVSHATIHRSVSQTNNGINGVNGVGSVLQGRSSRLASATEDLTIMHKPHSLSLSRATLTSKEFGVEKSLTSMGILALIAIIITSLSIVLLIQFNSMQSQILTDGAVEGVTGTRWYSDILDSGVVLVSFCLMLNLCCVVVCTGQSYFTAKMLKLPQGEERSCDFLKNTSGSRFLAVCSFFVSIPIFLVALILYILLEFRTIPATVSSALIGLAILFMIFSFGHNVHLWQREQSLINKRHAPPPGVFTGMNGGPFHSNQRQQYSNHNNHHTDNDGHRFAYSNHATDSGDTALDPMSVSNLSTLV
ncbi:uncharacterized protein LOC100888768 [Strongylocentrotus purpuratus]|uniref:Uncharacterized protein n=1 Tax=Strongylocentrotus purpuratus TaxID=7668 RepID=A0A7M7GH13_STRPU|nr:uncharacterized protein LOC100888768 [Strongylocentrotus purpuratus]|eukprot:XP_003726121.1 PREDICTED: uncharacterized protein LOC100888768 [Strongylocentrotus purpuratus]